VKRKEEELWCSSVALFGVADVGSWRTPQPSEFGVAIGPSDFLQLAVQGDGCSEGVLKVTLELIED